MTNQPIPLQPELEEYLRDLSEQESEWLLQVSYLYIQLEKWDAARCLLEALLVFEPHNIDGLVNLGYVHMEMHNYPITLKICEKLLKSSLKYRNRVYDRDNIETLRRLALQKLTDAKRQKVYQ